MSFLKNLIKPEPATSAVVTFNLLRELTLMHAPKHREKIVSWLSAKDADRVTELNPVHYVGYYKFLINLAL